MITGSVNAYREAILRLTVQGPQADDPHVGEGVAPLDAIYP
jgi:hypothetical protein